MQAIMRRYGSSLQMKQDEQYPVTPDGRYFVVRGRLWRRTNPSLTPSLKQSLVAELMAGSRPMTLDSALRAPPSIKPSTHWVSEGRCGGKMEHQTTTGVPLKTRHTLHGSKAWRADHPE